jgi:hypothetical protein
MGEKGSILLFGFGSRGDVQPLVCVGERMQDSGWNVRARFPTRLCALGGGGESVERC